MKIIKYSKKKYDITIIEIKEEIIKNFIELDEKNIFKDYPLMLNGNIYILQYPSDIHNIQKSSVSYGILNEITDNFNKKYFCSTNDGSSGSSILNLHTNKVIGVHKESSYYEYNIGTFLKDPINEYLDNKNIIYKKNEIKIQLKIENDDINKEIYFLDNTSNEYKFYIDGKDIEHNHDNLKELNELNTELYIDNIKNVYKKYFKPEKEGIYEIKLKLKNNIEDYIFMFYNCNKMISVYLSNFDTTNSTNMSYILSFCENITNLDLSSFNTKNVTNMLNMFYGCTNIRDLNLSSFNTNNVTNMGLIFKGCHSLINLDLSSFDTNNATNMDNMFSECNNLINLNLSSFNANKITIMN